MRVINIGYFCLLIGLLIPGLSLAENSEFNIMPMELVEDGRLHGCNPVNDFYSIDETSESTYPPYSYGFLDAYMYGKEIYEKIPSRSAAYWCEITSDSNKKYQLRIWVTKKEIWLSKKFMKIINEFSCGNIVEEMPYPDGVRINVRSGNLGYFSYEVNGQKKHEIINTEDNIVVIELRGTDYNRDWICHDGKWKYKIYD